MRDWCTHNVFRVYAIAFIVLVSFSLALLFWMPQLAHQPTVEQPIEESQVESPVISDEFVTVMIDNAPTVQQHDGIDQAEIVYEALVEGSRTRFMAVFNQHDLPQEIGPVRSARPYFLDWANDYGGMYWHAGGSPQALELIDSGRYSFVDVDEISYQGIYFYRNYNYANPHNLFTSQELIRTAWEDYQVENQAMIDFELKNDLTLEFRPVEEKYVHIPYSNAEGYYDVVWQYDRQTNSWRRQLDGKLYSVKNLVVLQLETELIDIERLGMQTIGHGDGYVFKDGQKQEIKWSKSSLDQPLQLLTGEFAVKLNHGKIWFQIVPTYLSIDFN